MPYPRISIVTPSFNQAQFLEEAIRSVVTQDYPNLEYIVQDGGSTDGSVELIKTYDSQITFWESGPDGGQSAALNKGFARATGGYLMWVNSDDQLEPGCLKNLVEGGYLEPDTLTVGRCRLVDEKGDVVRHHSATVKTLADLFRFKEVWMGGGYIVQPETVFPRKLFEKVGGLNTENFYCMDYELWVRLLDAGSRIRTVPVDVGVFRHHEQQKVASVYQVKHSLLTTACTLLDEVKSLTEEEREELRRDLKSYERELWLGHGKVSRLPLPENMRIALRKWYCLRSS